MMHILHTSDWHLGISLHNASLLQEQRFFIDDLIQTIQREKIDALVIAGDVYDRSVTSVEAVSLYDYAMNALCVELKVPVLICAGNHDSAARLSTCSELLKASGLYICGKLSRDMQPVILQDCAFYLLPYFSIDEVRYLYPEQPISNYNEAMACVLEHLRASFQVGKKNILLSHCFVSGAEVYDSDRAAIVGGSNMVTSSLFTGFDYVALGHLHKPQNITSSIRYSGSPLKFSFSEANHEKMYTIIDTDTIQQTLLPIPALHDLHVLKGDYDDVLMQAEAQKGSQDYYKVELLDRYSGLDVQETFSALLPNLLLLIGKTYESNMLPEVNMDDLSRFSPMEILSLFLNQTTGEPPTTEQEEWFIAALQAIEEGERQK